MIVTVAERKRAKAVALGAGVAALRDSLAAYASTHGGRLLLHGSAARGTVRFDSDVDLLLDFPQPAEAECWRLGLTPDIRPLRWCTPEFRAAVLPDAVVLA